MDKERFKQLAKKYFDDKLSEEELMEFLSLLDNHEDVFLQVVDDEVRIEQGTDFNPGAAFEELSQDERFAVPGRVARLRIYAWTAVACSILAIFGSFLYFSRIDLQHHNQQQIVRIVKKTAGDVGENHSDIVLADGTKLNLADIGGKELGYKGVKLSRVSANVYKVKIDPQEKISKSLFHEFKTAKGVSYALLLPDGSRVDLNSGTTLRLDPNFNVSNRDCELSGEAYFDVKRNEAIAFKVKTRDYDVKVLGTQFNIKTYAHNDYSQTALVKGNVHVAKNKKEVSLQPGYQVRAVSGVLGNKSKANLRDVLAWKEGYFRFTNLNIEDIMRDIMTWYAIEEIEYQYTSNESFTGSIKRTRSLMDVLQSIETISDLKFEIKEGRVIVRK